LRLELLRVRRLEFALHGQRRLLLLKEVVLIVLLSL
jgi:hypothetical protein